jgi:N-acylneuraminate cytidylyltransferase
MKNIAIIPARGGSKRLSNKNILPFDGLPLVAHSILYAQHNPTIIDEIYVSTDCPQIKQIALDFGAQVMDRPARLSGDFEPTITALQHVIQELDYAIDNIVLLQPTNPLRPKNLLEEAYALFQQNTLDSLFTVSREYKKFGKITNNKYLPFNYHFGQRSQDLEPLFFENGLLYITQSKLLLTDVILSENAFPFEINHPYATVDIDTKDDLDYAHWVVTHQKEK